MAADEELARAQGEIGTLRNRVKALEANGAELLRRAEKAEAELDEMEGVVTDLGVVRLQLQDATDRARQAVNDALANGWDLAMLGQAVSLALTPPAS